jgi:imidazolonepropionase-like amidohydrolase
MPVVPRTWSVAPPCTLIPVATTKDRELRTVIRAEWLFDGCSSELMRDPVVVLEGDRIVSVDGGIPPPLNARVVDLCGATLLPGLVDTHQHLVFDAGPDPVASLAARNDEDALRTTVEAARVAARGGVTTVRDLGDRGYLSLSLRGRAGLPTIVASGPPITSLGGHCGPGWPPLAVTAAQTPYTRHRLCAVCAACTGSAPPPRTPARLHHTAQRPCLSRHPAIR